MLFRILAVPAVVACALFAAVVRAELPEVLLTSPLAEVWGKAPSINHPRLSPNGSKMLFQSQDRDGLGVAMVLDFETKDLNVVGVGTEQAYDLAWCEWVGNDRVVCDLVFAVNADGSELTQMQRGRVREPSERVSRCGPGRASGAIDITMDWMPDDSEHIACNARTQYNVFTGLVEDLGVGFGRDLRGTLLSDGHNFARLQQHRDQQGGYDRWYFRHEIGGEWTQFYETNPLEFSEALRPVGFGADLGILYHLAPVEGLWGLHAFVLNDEPESHELFTHPLFDVELVDTMGAYDRVVAAAYLDERPQRVPLDARVRDVYQSAQDAFPGANIEVVDESWDARKYLLLVRPPNRAGSFFLLDFEEGTLDPLGAMYEHLSDVELADTQSVSFPAADGGIITGHVTLPPGSAGTLPTVIIPRARPSRHDIEDPHYLVQYLVANGYAVLRLNNRGPDEYGEAWLPNRTAFAWQKTAADIDSAMQYLVEQGVAEEDRICALGRDVGAYATFMHAIENPAALKCIIGIGATAQTGRGDWATVIAGDYSVLQRDSSPIRRSRDFDASVLLFHGRFDGTVDMLANSGDLSQSLDRRDFDVTFIEYEYARHNIERAPYRIDMLTRIGEFLDRNIGAAN